MKCPRIKDFRALELYVQPGDVLFFRGSGVVSRLIRFFSKKPPKNKKSYSHAEIVYMVRGGSVGIISARETNGGEVSRDLLSRYDNGKTDIKVVRPKYKSKALRDLAIKFALSKDGAEYDYYALWDYFKEWCKKPFRIKHKRKDAVEKWYCSEICGEALEIGAIGELSDLSPSELNVALHDRCAKDIVYYEA